MGVVTEVMALATATERGRLRPSQKLMPGWDMVDFMATVVWALAMGVTEVMALDTATERGPLMLRPSRRLMPGWDMVDSTATVVLALVMVVMLDTAMERGLLTLSLGLIPGMDMM